jgi:predicted deacetylase
MAVRRPLISYKPELRRNSADVADLSGVSGAALGEGALGAQDRGECSANVPIQEGRLRLNKGCKIVEEVPRHAVDREFLKPGWQVELDENSILKGFGVRVGVDYFAEGIVGLVASAVGRVCTT